MILRFRYATIRVLIFILIFYNQLKTSYSQYNLYHTETNLKRTKFDNDCLYQLSHYRISDGNGLIPWCIRQETVNEFVENNQLCHGTELTFKQLKLNNVSVNDLFYWNAVMEIIDLYEKYLLLPNLVNDNEVYCNCSHLSLFGKSCQYDIDRDDDVRIFSWFFIFPENIAGDESPLTCYVGIQCQTNLFCLDWRQICNGIVDCDHGEDEPAELCLQMESNECDADKEFRCQIGLCIPISLQCRAWNYCFDRSDSIQPRNKDYSKYLSKLCMEYPSLECDETNHGWKQFSCNNGQYMSYSDLTLKTSQQGRTCVNNRHLAYLKRLFSTANEDECWIAMICLTGFDYLYSHIDCPSNETIERNINEYCPNEFSFPSNSIVYSYVFFFYEKINRHNWLTYNGPNYICYKKESCPNNTWILLTISKNNLICFHVDQQIFSWTNFYEYVSHTFSSCYSRPSVHIDETMFYKCKLSNTLISNYRVKNKRKDCFFNEDENENVDLCSFKINDKFQCFTNQSQCIRQSFIKNGEYDCSDGSDEYFEGEMPHYGDRFCELHLWKKRNVAEIYRFSELCDNIVNYHLFTRESNETDETDCEHWLYSCNSPYTNCDQIWNCPDGRDEIDCKNTTYNDYIRTAFQCQIHEHYCLRLINNGNDIERSCLHFNRTNDGINDCIGGTDERLINICMRKYPIDHKRRFHCQNSSQCILVDQVCDRKIDCPFEDDERICPWLFQRNASTFHCLNVSLNSPVRCDQLTRIQHHSCTMKEDLWFCDLETIEPENFGGNRFVYEIIYETYPPLYKTIEKIQDTNQLTRSMKRTNLLMETNDNKWLCNFGFRIRSSILSNQSYCLCPPTYYGEYCQYQSEHLIVVLAMKVGYFMEVSTVFRLLVYLLNENNVILSYEETIYNHIWTKDHSTYVYLMYERMKELSLEHRVKSKYVRIDSYIVNEISVQYISSWMYSVLFPFLPVNKLAIELSLVNQSYRMFNCKKTCSSHGKCMHYLNLKDKEYCWCDQGWFGDTCQVQVSSNLCNQTSCAPHAQCIIVNNERKCICPLGRSGNQCYITYNYCATIKCKNNGTCLPIGEATMKDATCVCTEDYLDLRCNKFQSTSNIIIDANISDISSVPAIILIFTSIQQNTLQQVHKNLWDNITLPVVLTFHVDIYRFAFAQMYLNFSTNFYYIIVMKANSVGYPYLNTSVQSKYRCKDVKELFNQTILDEYSYLKRLKLYHLPCHQDHDLQCFFDEYRMCICTLIHRSDCFLFSHNHSSCNYCLNDGKCLTSERKEEDWKSICICPECSSGKLCQFSLGDYYVTLDTLVGKEIRQELSFNQQSMIIRLTLAILIIILIFSFIFNTISLIILSNKKNRQVGCDFYLLSLTIVGQFGLILLFLRFIYMIVIQMYIIDNQSFLQISCILLEYSVRLIASIFDWLTVCIAIERTYIISKDIQFTQTLALKTLKMSRWILIFVVLMNILTTLHRPFHLILVDEISFTGQPQGHPWCILNFQSASWNIYEKVINIGHLVLPLIFNVSSAIFLILRKAKIELASTVRKDERTRYSVIIEQIFKYKPLLIGTAIIILLEIPRFILTFTLSCITHTWQQYLHLTGYLLSFVPLSSLLFIYIVPSPKHNQQLKVIINKILCRNVS